MITIPPPWKKLLIYELQFISDEKGLEQGEVKEDKEDKEDEKEKIRKQLIDDEEEDRKLLESIPDESMWYMLSF